MNLPSQIAKHFLEVYFGGNWTTSNLRDTLSDVTWQQATTKLCSINTIATLVFHIHYFTKAVLKVLEGGPLQAHDRFSFSHPPIESGNDWQEFLKQCWDDANRFAELASKLPESKLWEDFEDKKYGSYYRNLTGIIEHAHYHLGQISLLKKILQEKEGQPHQD